LARRRAEVAPAVCALQGGWFGRAYLSRPRCRGSDLGPGAGACCPPVPGWA